MTFTSMENEPIDSNLLIALDTDFINQILFISEGTQC